MKKILLIPYGTEVAFFQRTIELWQARMPNPQGWTIITYRLAPGLENNQLSFKGNDLVIPEHPEISEAIKYDNGRFSLTGNWSDLEKLHFIYRRIMVSRFLLSYFEGSLVVYFLTSTSIINLNLLDFIDLNAPTRKFVAGQFLKCRYGDGHLSFPSGSGFITNRIGVASFAEQSNLIPVYDDIWAGLVLKQFDQIRFPRLDIIHPHTVSESNINSYLNRIRMAFNSGIWHCRVKLNDNRVSDLTLDNQFLILKEAHRVASIEHTASLKSRLLLSELI